MNFRLKALLENIYDANEDGGKIIIFVETKKKVESITRSIRRFGWPAVCIHGDKSQHERDFVLRGVKLLLSVMLVIIYEKRRLFDDIKATFLFCRI